jgi:protein-tyrosine phosphatase
VVRADNLRRLSDDGWAAAQSYGVREVVDLRFVRDRDAEPDLPAGIGVTAVSLFGEHDPAEALRTEELLRGAAGDAEVIELFYLDVLESRSQQVVAALRAVAAAAPTVVVHCFVGKDRTGIVSALLLRLAGVPDEAVVDDYAQSGPVVGPLVDDWIARAEDEHERAYRARVCAAPADGLRRVLMRIRERWGGEEAYLLQAGLAPAELDRLRGLLR